MEALASRVETTTMDAETKAVIEEVRLEGLGVSCGWVGEMKILIYARRDRRTD